VFTAFRVFTVGWYRGRYYTSPGRGVSSVFSDQNTCNEEAETSVAYVSRCI